MKKIYSAILSLGILFPFGVNASEENIEGLTACAEESIRTSYELSNQNWIYPENNEQRLSPPKNTA